MPKCKQCKTQYPKDHKWLQVGLARLCGETCKEAAIQAALAKVRAKAVRKQGLEKEANSKALRQFNKQKPSYQHKLTQTPAYNKMRRYQWFLWFKERGLQPTCISCERTVKGRWSIGHYITVGASGFLRYDDKNTYLQCWWNCNYKKSGNIAGTGDTIGFTKGILKLFGPEEGQRRLDYLEANKGKKAYWEWQKIRAFRLECFKKIKELEKIYLA